MDRAIMNEIKRKEIREQNIMDETDPVKAKNLDIQN